ncbi:MAG: DUF4912 domain-containing protein [Proteobacteria bacterium]|nr:DUF4912 domain-containing protein [Pseudomonadota bacterium]
MAVSRKKKGAKKAKKPAQKKTTRKKTGVRSKNTAARQDARKKRPTGKAVAMKKAAKKGTAKGAKPARKAPAAGKIAARKPAAKARPVRAAARRSKPRIEPALAGPTLLHIDDLESMVAQASQEASDRIPTEAKKFEIGVPTNGLAAPQGDLPWEYGKDRAVILVVDPTFVFTYWEITNESMRRAVDSVGLDAKLTLRFYDVTHTHVIEGSRYWDVEVFDRLGNWYLRLASPEQKLCLEVGLKNPTGRFHMLARSNVMRLPPQGLAKPGPIKWMVVTPSGEKLISDVEDYTDADLDLLKRILGPYFFDLLMRGKLASITGSSIEAIFYEVENFLGMQAGESPGGSPWSMAR